MDLLLLDRVVTLIDEGPAVAVRVGAPPDSSLVAVPLGVVRHVACASPDDLRTRRCVRFAGPAPQPEWSFRSPPVKAPIVSVLSCKQHQVAIDAGVSGQGPGPFLSDLVAPLGQAGRLVCRPGDRRRIRVVHAPVAARPMMGRCRLHANAGAPR